jgi:hypothetical protein
MCTLWHHLHGWQIFLVGVQAENPSTKSGTVAKPAFSLLSELFGRFFAYLAPTLGGLATQMSCIRVHTPYVHPLATFSWLADDSCRCSSANPRQKNSDNGKTRLFLAVQTFWSVVRLPSTYIRWFGHTNKLQKGAHTLCAPFGNFFSGWQIFLVGVVAKMPAK